MSENNIANTVAIWREVIIRLGLSPNDQKPRQPDAEFFIGCHENVQIEIELRLESSGCVAVACSVGSSKPFVQSFEIRPQATSFRSTSAYEIGDPAFDDVAMVMGPETLIRSLLDFEIRNHLKPLIETWGIVVLDGWLHLVSAHCSRIEDVDTGVAVIDQMVAVINQLNATQLGYSGGTSPLMRKRLAAIGESDPIFAVRFHAYALLERTTGQYSPKLLELAEALIEEHPEYVWPLVTQSKSEKVRAWAFERCSQFTPTPANLTRLIDAFESADTSARRNLIQLLKNAIPSETWAWDLWLRLVRLGKSPTEHKLIWELVDRKLLGKATELTRIVKSAFESNDPAIRSRALVWLGHTLSLEEFWRLLGADLNQPEHTERMMLCLGDEGKENSAFFLAFMRLLPEQRWRLSSLLREIHTDWATVALSQTIPANNHQLEEFPEYGRHQIFATLDELRSRGKRGVGEARLIGLLKCSHNRFSAAAAETLGAVGTRASLGPLKDIAKALFGSPERKTAAKFSLERLEAVFEGEPGRLSLSGPSGSGDLSLPEEDGALSLEEEE